MIDVIDISPLFESIVTKVDEAIFAALGFHVWFDEGRYIEITRNLSIKDGGVETKTQKYPLIWLVYPHTIVEAIGGIGIEIKGLQIVIATRTEPNSTTPKRKEVNFIPKLYPILRELKKQIDQSGYFNDLDFDNNFERIDQPYWDGKDGAQQANMFNDFIDAIQLKSITLEVNEETCERFKLISGLIAH